MQNDTNIPETPTSTEPEAHKPERKSGVINKFRQDKRLLIAVVAMAVLLIGGGVYALTKDSSPKTANNDESGNRTENSEAAPETNDSVFLSQYGQNCEERDVRFTSAPMKMDELAIIRPLGAVSDGHVTPTDHVYVGAGNMNAKANSYPVLMPADGTVTVIAAMPGEYIGDRSGQQTASEDHRIVVSHSCRYFSIFIHINRLGDALSTEVGALQPNESKQVSIDLKAGDIIGYVGAQTFDWTPIDTQTVLKGFITPSLYDGESWKIHTVSPFDLYEEPLKSQLEAKSLRSVAPLGGKIDYDQPGKLVGNWFREGTGGYSGTSNNGGRYWDSHLSIVPDYIDPDALVVSIGNWTNDTAKQFMVTNNPTKPENVSASSGIVEYELKTAFHATATGGNWNGSTAVKGLKLTPQGSVQGTIIFQVLDGEKLKVEKFPGKTAAQVDGFTSAAQIYER